MALNIFEDHQIHSLTLNIPQKSLNMVVVILKYRVVLRGMVWANDENKGNIDQIKYREIISNIMLSFANK